MLPRLLMVKIAKLRDISNYFLNLHIILLNYMKRRLYLLLMICGLLLTAVPAHAQFGGGAKVKWTMTVEVLPDGYGVATIKAVPMKGWHLYGTDLPDGGPKATTIDFSGSTGVAAEGPLTPSVEPTSVEDPMFEMTINWWEKPVCFTQRFKILDRDNAKVEASITFMACNDVTCTPPSTVKLTLNF